MKPKLDRTPDTLQARFGLAPELGSVAVPRVWHGVCGEKPSDRKNFLMTAFALVMSGAIAAEGQHRASVKGIRRGVNQEAMAAFAGVRRETIGRRMNRIAAAPNGWQRQRHLKLISARRDALTLVEMHRATCPKCSPACTAMVKLEARAEAACAKVRPSLDEYTPRRGKVAELLHRRRRFGMAARYTLQLEQRSEIPAIFDVDGRECKRFFDPGKAAAACERMNQNAANRGIGPSHYVLGTIEIEPRRTSYAPPVELAARLKEWFDQGAASDGFKNIPRWVWAPDLRTAEGRPMGTIARMVMSYYISAGLLDEMKDAGGKITSARGWLNIHQQQVSAKLGISVREVYQANCQWEALGVLRIQAGIVRETEGGKRRGAMNVIYLPFRILTAEEAQGELQRVARRIRQVVALRGPRTLPMALEAQRIAQELLAAWQGREHCLGAYWKEYERQLRRIGTIHPLVIEDMVPVARKLPEIPEPGWFDTQP